MRRFTSRHFFWTLCVVALVLRLAAVLIHPITNLPDSHDYNTLAQEILHGQPYQVTDIWGQPAIASRMPGYPIFIAAIYAVAGEHSLAVLIVQAFLGAACVPLVYLVARRVSVATGLVAAALMALDPLGILFSAMLLSENRFCPHARCRHLLAGQNFRDYAMAASGDRGRGAGGYRRLFAGGVDLSAAGAAAGAVGARPRRALASLAITLLVVALFLLPWQHRNHALLGMGYTHLTTLEGLSLYEAVFPAATGGPLQDVIARAPLPPGMRDLNEATARCPLEPSCLAIYPG